MKKYLILLIIVTSFGCDQIKCDCSTEADTARWNEKSRWMDYQINIKDQKVFEIELNVISGKISMGEGFSQMEKVATDTTLFYK